MSTLLMRLAGPMQSWGVESRFSIRDTAREPSKSGVLGLLCAALGKPREERDGDGFPQLDELAALPFGVRVDRAGRMSRDYQTAGGSHRAGESYGVAKAKGKTRDTVVSERFFLADAEFVVGLQGADLLIERLVRALQSPCWPLYLGRKSYVPTRPTLDSVSSAGLREALSRASWFARTAHELNNPPARLRAVFEAPADEGSVRMDVPVSFATRRFAGRRLAVEWIELARDLVKEDPHVSEPTGS